MSGLVQQVRSRREEDLAQLLELLRIPSISTDPARAQDVRRAATWVRDRLLEAGCQKAELHETPGHPIVYGEWLGAPGRPTQLVYGHYDVQPVDPVDQWVIPPFEAVVRDGRIHARGASDDKGQFIVHVNALAAHLRQSGTCPVNVKFLIEGEEEIGSSNLEPFLARERGRLACDAVVISDTAMFKKGLPSICYGLRGLAYVEVKVQGSDRDLHSGSYGGAVINPANALAGMISALRDARGRVRIPGFYDDVRRLTAAERRAIASLPHSDRQFGRSIAAPALHGEAGFSTLERIWARPTLDVNGIWAGFTGEGAKTVIPATAHAKISMRLVPDQSPARVTRALRAYLKQIAPEAVAVSVRELHGGEPWLAPTDHPALQAAGRALARAFGRKPVLVREGGSIPVVASFGKRLRVPAVLMGIGLNEDNLHAPNEKLDLDNFYQGIEAAAFLMEELGTGMAAS
jgi:acetylornithine deacetylase/succinyl-diaminopimelate desuccinylase-like protein